MRRGFIFLLFLISFAWIATPIFAQRRNVSTSVVLLKRAISPSPDPQPTLPAKIEYNLPDPGILPDHPLYILKVLRDRIIIIFTKDRQKRINLYILMADKRLAMGQALVDRGKPGLGATTISKGEKYLLGAVGLLRELKKGGRTPDVGLVNKVVQSIAKHEEVVGELAKRVSGEAGSSMGLSLQNAQDAGRQLKEFKERERIGL